MTANGHPVANDAGLPWPPGDEHDLEAAAVRLDRAADDVARFGTAMGEHRAQRIGWSGTAADSFDEATAAFDGVLGQAAGAMRSSGRALRRLAGEVAEAQRVVLREAREVIRRREAAERAERLQRAAIGDLAATAERLVARGVDDVGERVAGLRDAAERRIAGAATARDAYLDHGTAALRRAQAECDRVATADAACAAALEAAASRSPLQGTVPGSPPATPFALAVGAAFLPELRFDASEDHFPIDVREWLGNADLRYDENGRPYFDPRGEDIREGARGRLTEATMPFTYHLSDDGELRFEYGTFYAFNDFPNAPSTAVDHEGDFEPVTIQFAAGRGRPEHVDFEAHGHTGVRAWPETDRDGTRVRVYPAHGGHGNHPSADRFENDFSSGEHGPGIVHFLVDEDDYEDDADGRGVRWRPRPDQLLDARSVPELRGPARFGEDTGHNPQSFLQPGQRSPDAADLDRAPRHAEPAGGNG